MEFRDGGIEGVIIRELIKFPDERGWLSELFRTDEIEEVTAPVMSYVSLTHPGVTRGPHAHKEQTDYFVFNGPSTFELYLWDAREGSSTHMNRLVLKAGVDNPAAVVVPPGVVHAYKNIGATDGIVLNFPNRLYMGHGKKEAVDEIRYEDDPDSPYRVQ